MDAKQFQKYSVYPGCVYSAPVSNSDIDLLRHQNVRRELLGTNMIPEYKRLKVGQYIVLTGKHFDPDIKGRMGAIKNMSLKWDDHRETWDVKLKVSCFGKLVECTDLDVSEI